MEIINTTHILKKNLLDNKHSLSQLYSYKDDIYKLKIKNNSNQKNIRLLDDMDNHIDYKINKIQHEKTKILTVISTIFLPLGFIVGFFGMNFKSMGVPSLKYGIFTIIHSEKFIFGLSLLSIFSVLSFFYYIEYKKKY